MSSTPAPDLDLGPIGIFSTELRFHPDRGAAAAAAAEIEALGYGAIWFAGGAGGDDVFPTVEHLLGATERVVVATGIVNLWMHTPAEVAAAWGAIEAAHPDRFLLGIGVSHAALVDRQPGLEYAKPLSTTRTWLDRLDACEPRVPDRRRILAALGPKMLELARDRTLGTHPYLSPVAHTAVCRQVVGPDGRVALAIPTLLEPDPERARALIRSRLAMYLTLPNYTNNMLRHGFEAADLADGGSDRLVDALYAWGDEAAIAARVAEHRAAGADHICLQVVVPEENELALDTWRRLAPALVAG